MWGVVSKYCPFSLCVWINLLSESLDLSLNVPADYLLLFRPPKTTIGMHYWVCLPITEIKKEKVYSTGLFPLVFVKLLVCKNAFSTYTYLEKERKRVFSSDESLSKAT